MVTEALFVRMEAGADIESFLRSGLPIIQDEPAAAWFSIRLGPAAYGLVDIVANEAGREARFSGRVAAALMAMAAELLAQPPALEEIGVLATRPPRQSEAILDLSRGSLDPASESNPKNASRPGSRANGSKKTRPGRASKSRGAVLL